MSFKNALVFIALLIDLAAASQSRIVNGHIERINEQNKDDARKPIIPSAYYYFLIFAAVLLVVYFIIVAVEHYR